MWNDHVCSVSAFVAEGVPLTYVAKFLGHKTTTLIENTYRPYMPDVDDVIGQALEADWSPNVSSGVTGTG